VNAVQGQAAGCPDIRPSRSRGGRFGNTAGLSGELSAGDVVAVGDMLLAVGRPAGWEPVSEPLTEVRTREHGTHPLPGRFPDTGDRTTIPSPDQGAT
jgi:hypothetical protein